MDNLFYREKKDEEAIRQLVKDFFRVYELGDREKAYNYLSSGFRNHISFEAYNRMARFKTDIGMLTEIRSVQVKKAQRRGLAECRLDWPGKTKIVILACQLEEDGLWKMDGRSLYKKG